ncbi:PaaI family thioesterase [Cytobacillus dafuensis]|uniref:Acyl-coenzyme A thioesterase THEM4 n=1 Tax=Cytobacillus dafuensis TaxID=1742359 RepID=A0A5B8Z7R4_CYTDA|nr:PaaI family thioesterase [Cytobacillus dafuensis]QED47416.1 PaaI family thioesterase [Cytobacillus dafuensis]
MNKHLNELFKACIENATEEELEVLTSVLSGFQKKQKQINSSYIGGLLHMERTIHDEICELTVPLSPLLHNSLGIVHGGMTATVIDSAMGTLANSLLPDGFSAVTTQLNIHYLSIGNGEFLQCKAHIDHKGTKTMVISADVYRSDKKKIAQATGSFFIIKKKNQ